MKIEKAPSWAFEIDGKLCHWSETSKGQLIVKNPDLHITDGYKPVAVYIVRRKDLRKKRGKKK